jgi:hypothetical protein
MLPCVCIGIGERKKKRIEKPTNRNNNIVRASSTFTPLPPPVPFTLAHPPEPSLLHDHVVSF